MRQDAIPAGTGDATDLQATPAPETTALRPALFARYGALEHLRYDFPLVLVEGDGDGDAPVLRPLSNLVDAVLQEICLPGAAGDALRHQVLRLEAAIRQRVAKGARDTLINLWRECAAAQVAASGEPAFGPLDSSLDRARAALRVDGPVIDCDAATPTAVFIHAWNAVHATKAKEFRKKVDGLILRLSDILKADHMNSDAARTPEALQSSIGTSFGETFDFFALSRVLSHGQADERSPDGRERRIHRALLVLKAQRFYGPGRSSERKPGQPEPHDYIFESSAAALDAFRDRLPEIVEFVKAQTIAELEIENKYSPELHDPIFETFDESDLSAEQLALLPYPLVCLRDGRTEPAETLQAFEALASGLSIKVLITTDDILGGTSPEPSRSAFGVGSARLAAMALGLNSAFVLQCSSALLHRSGDSITTGMRYDGPALFSVFSGAGASAPHIAPYLLAAAATESRAFPTFSYDPSAGPDWAHRFDLSNNPQVGDDWVHRRMDYEDENLQRQTEDLAFTFVDFAVSDRRYGRYCQPKLHAEWSDAMLPVADRLIQPGTADDGKLPYVLTVGADDRLRRTVIDDRLVAAAAGCSDAWRQLQELAGINNSHANRLLAQERAAWQAERELLETAADETPGAVSEAPGPVPIAEPAATQAEAPEPAETGDPAPSLSDLRIETSRCTTCNECTQINNRLFKYNDDMQAYVADPDAGSYREIVEAAESCQVSIIHPGQPRNPDEPNLDDLIARAEAFN